MSKSVHVGLGLTGFKRVLKEIKKRASKIRRVIVHEDSMVKI